MNDPLLRLDSLFASLDTLDEMDSDALEHLVAGINEATQELLHEVKQGIPPARREVWRRYLHELLARLPAAQEKVTAASSLVARQMAAENRRVQRMRDEGKGFEGRRGLFQRNA